MGLFESRTQLLYLALVLGACAEESEPVGAGSPPDGETTTAADAQADAGDADAGVADAGDADGQDSTAAPAAPPTDEWTTTGLEWFECDRAAYPLPTACGALERLSPSGDKTVEVALRLFESRDADGSTPLLLMVNGGPGLSSASFSEEATALVEAGIAVGLVDLVGTGESTRIPCFSVASSLTSCLDDMSEAGEIASHLSTTGAAFDVLALAEVLGSTYESVALYGQSYGSFVAQRALQLAPTGFDAVVLDGAFDPDPGVVTYLDFAAADVIDELLERCGEQPACAEAITAGLPAAMDAFTPLELLLDALDRMDRGHCPDLAGFSGTTAREGAQRLLGLMADCHGAASLVPAVVRRLARCQASDLEALSLLGSRLGGSAAGLSQDFLTTVHLIRTELWDDDADPAALLNELSTRSARRGILNGFGTPLPEGWPAAAPAAFESPYAAPGARVLVLAGTLDSSTPIAGAERVANALEATLFTVPNGAHGLLVPLITPWPRSAHPCVRDAVVHFLRSEPIAFRCATEVAPVEFIDRIDAAEALLGDLDPWAETR